MCCVADAIRLLPGDDPTQYETEPHPVVADALMLAHKDNGECLYLGPTGCIIHDRKPIMCREMDCRLIATRISWTKARKLPKPLYRIWRRGRDLLNQTQQ